jgi:hypothetical protein
MIRRAREAFRAGRLLDEFIPIPPDLKDTVAGGFGDAEKQAELDAQSAANRERYGYANWYDFCVSEWGTKWDVGGEHDGDASEDSDHSLTMTFDSAWSPPVTAYEKFEALGFTVQGYYYEPGMCFAGIYSDGEDDCYDYSNMTAKQVRDMLPEELDEMFAISDYMEDWEEENAEISEESTESDRA